MERVTQPVHWPVKKSHVRIGRGRRLWRDKWNNQKEKCSNHFWLHTKANVILVKSPWKRREITMGLCWHLEVAFLFSSMHHLFNSCNNGHSVPSGWPLFKYWNLAIIISWDISPQDTLCICVLSVISPLQEKPRERFMLEIYVLLLLFFQGT